MKKYVERVPLPISGVMLGYAALGNLLQSYSEGLRLACGAVAVFVLALVLLKLIMCPQSVKEDLQNPIVTSCFGTFSMGIMLLSTYAKPFIGPSAYYLWILGILLHIVLIIYFTVKFVMKLQMPKVFASYFIVYVGIVVASVTAPAFENQSWGTIAFWFGFVCLLVLLVLVTIRYMKYKEIPNPAKPLICIYAAPTSLCVAGYVQSVVPKSKTFLLGMFVVATIIYIFALVKMLGLLQLPFFPSYAAFTFPFVISAIATKQTMACLMNMESPMPSLKPLVLIETIIAVVLMLYVFIKYMEHIFIKK